MRKTLVSLAFTVLLSLLMIVRPILAGSISAGTYDATGIPRDTFASGEAIRIVAESSHKPITVTVTDPDGNVAHFEIYDGYIYDKTLNGLTDKSGWYTVEASSPIDNVRKNYACTYLHVVPEIPLGTLGALAAILLAMGFFSFVRHKP